MQYSQIFEAFPLSIFSRKRCVKVRFCYITQIWCHTINIITLLNTLYDESFIIFEVDVKSGHITPFDVGVPVRLHSISLRRILTIIFWFRHFIFDQFAIFLPLNRVWAGIRVAKVLSVLRFFPSVNYLENIWNDFIYSPFFHFVKQATTVHIIIILSKALQLTYIYIPLMCIAMMKSSIEI